MKYIAAVVMGCLVTGTVWAQPSRWAPKKVGKIIAPQAARVQKLSPKQQRLQDLVKRVNALQKATFSSQEKLDRVLEVSLEGFRLPQWTASVLTKANEARIQASKQFFKDRLALYTRERKQVLASLDIKPAVRKVNYKPLLDAKAKIIFLGEQHFVGPIRRQIAQTVLQYRKAYPDRKVYLLTEFLEMNYPAEPDYNLYRGVLMEGKKIAWPYAPLLARLKQNGVQVYGLEPVRGLQEMAKSMGVPDPNFVKGSLSLVGQFIRNKSWAQTIRRFIAKDPQAVFFVYTGFGHSSYKYLENLPSMLQEYPSQVFLFDVFGSDTLNPAFAALFRNDFLADSKSYAVTVLKNPKYRSLIGADVTVYVHN